MGKIKNTEGSAMSVGLLVARLKYGLYVGHLSKLVFHFMFIVVRLVVVVSSVRLACNGFIYATSSRKMHQSFNRYAPKVPLFFLCEIIPNSNSSPHNILFIHIKKYLLPHFCTEFPPLYPLT